MSGMNSFLSQKESSNSTVDQSFDWPTFQHDAQRSGFSQSTAPRDNNTLWNWSQPDNYGFYDSPVVIDKILYVTAGYSLYALNESNGGLFWSIAYGDSSAGPPTVEDGIIYWVAGNENLYAINANTREVIWKTTGMHFGNPGAIPTVVDGKIIIGERSDPGKIWGLDALSGAVLWSYQTGSVDGIFPSIAVDESTAYAVARTSWWEGIPTTLYALDLQNGQKKWSYSMGLFKGWCVRPSSPLVAYESVFAIENGTLYALNNQGGSLRWTRNLGDYEEGVQFHSSPAAAYGMIFVGSGDHNVYALNATDGELVWNHTTPGMVYSSPAVADGKLFVGALGGLLAINAINGSLIWQYSLGSGSVSSSPAIADGIVFMGLRSTLYSFPDFDALPHVNITVDPLFYDNKGDALQPSPSSWTALFPNGTEKVCLNPETFCGPTGTYSIIEVVWNGRQVNHTTPHMFLDSDAEWRPQVNCTLPVEISISLSTFTSYLGFKVQIEGNVSWKDTGISSILVHLSYSVTLGTSWTDISLVSTGLKGEFAADWLPAATGDYIVKANWGGNLTFPAATTMVNLAVEPYENEYVFTVESNSTISDLEFNTNNRKLGFSVSGENGTIGYTRVTIAKSLVYDPSMLKLRLDGLEYNHTVADLGNAWVLEFTYAHSIHQVEVDMSETWISEFSLVIILFMVTTLFAVTICRGSTRDRSV